MQRTSGWAIASLVCAILGACGRGVPSILGLAFGFIALSEIRNSGGAIGGEGLAKAGIIISIIVMGGAFLLLLSFLIFGAWYAHFLSGSVHEFVR
jgi:hypothetical protein